jgi:hypothetical protein
VPSLLWNVDSALSETQSVPALQVPVLEQTQTQETKAMSEKSGGGKPRARRAQCTFRLSRAASKAFNAMKADDWLEDDWRDLLAAQTWVIRRVARRHKRV